MVGLTVATLAIREPLRRTLTSPVVPLVLLTALTAVLLAGGHPLASVCGVAGVAGVALSGST